MCLSGILTGHEPFLALITDRSVRLRPEFASVDEYGKGLQGRVMERSTARDPIRRMWGGVRPLTLRHPD
jgi:hypothetical protein